MRKSKERNEMGVRRMKRMAIDELLIKIPQKIKDCGLENHAFYFYLLPLNDAEAEKKSIMQHVLDGDVDL